MIQPNPRDPFTDTTRVAEALAQARNAAIRRHAASISGLPLTTDAVITEIKEKKKVGSGGAPDGMDDMNY